MTIRLLGHVSHVSLPFHSIPHRRSAYFTLLLVAIPNDGAYLKARPVGLPARIKYTVL